MDKTHDMSGTYSSRYNIFVTQNHSSNGKNQESSILNCIIKFDKKKTKTKQGKQISYFWVSRLFRPTVYG